MPDRVEQMLRTAARDAEFPPTPDLAGAIRGELSRPAPYRPPIRRVLVLAALTLLTTAATVLAASPGARDAVLEFFGIDGASVEVVPRLPDAPTPSTPLGEPVSLSDAQRRVGFDILTPRGARPRSVYLSERVPGGVITFVTTGLEVTQLQASVERDLLGKLVTQGTRIKRLPGAFWLTGAPHVVFLRDARGQVIEESLRRAGNVLVAERAGLVIRIEGAHSLAAAVAVARSLG
jgi:hypothetical protein